MGAVSSNRGGILAFRTSCSVINVGTGCGIGSTVRLSSSCLADDCDLAGNASNITRATNQPKKAPIARGNIGGKKRVCHEFDSLISVSCCLRIIAARRVCPITLRVRSIKPFVHAHRTRLMILIGGKRLGVDGERSGLFRDQSISKRSSPFLMGTFGFAEMVTTCPRTHGTIGTT